MDYDVYDFETVANEQEKYIIDRNNWNDTVESIDYLEENND